ncbi:MAG: LysM domain-containing protein [Acidimicrobiales bacterium]
MTPSVPRLVALAAVLLALGAWLDDLGDSVTAPPLTSWRSAVMWYETVGTETAALALVRLLAMAFVLWMLVAILLQILICLPALRSFGPLADLFSPRSLQRLGHGMAGLSLTAGLAAPAPSAGTPQVPPDPTTPGMTVPGPSTPSTIEVSTTTTAHASDSGTATMRVVDPHEQAPSNGGGGTATMRAAPADSGGPTSSLIPPPPTTALVPVPSSSVVPPDPVDEPADAHGPGVLAPAALPPAPGQASAGGAAETVVVAPGDSLWSIAAEELAGSRAPIEQDVAVYWARLIEANRSRLVDPHNPDLIFPGQVLTLLEGDTT